jgi:hypothetical protein
MIEERLIVGLQSFNSSVPSILVAGVQTKQVCDATPQL